jgi:hypothetical protein
MTSFSGGRSRREPLTMGKQLVNFITCGCKSSAPFFSSPGPKGHVSFCHHFASVVVHVCKLYILSSSLKPLNRFGPNLAEMFIWEVLYQICYFGADQKSNMAARANNVLIGWNFENLLVRNYSADEIVTLLKWWLGGPLPSLLFLSWLHIQDGRHRATIVYHWTLWEFHSKTFFWLDKLNFLRFVNVPWMILHLIYYFGADWKSNMAARANKVFWLIATFKIFLSETTQPIEL